MFKLYIRPIMEFSSCVWNTGFHQDVTKLEAVQRRWTKSVAGFANLSYSERLNRLNLYSVKGRLLRIDLIKVWKIFNNLSPIKPEDLFILSNLNTCGHSFKIFVPYSNCESRKRFFFVRTIPLWNSLPTDLVSSTSLSTFKQGLHVFLNNLLFEFE